LEQSSGIVESKKRVYSDTSVRGLIFCNLVMMIWAVAQKWPLANMIWVYWIQSVGIGFWAIINILALKEFTTKDFILGERVFPPNLFTKIFAVLFFSLIYGIFHSAYAGFLVEITGAVYEIPIVFVGGIFFFNQFYSFVYKKERYYKGKKPQIGDPMFFAFMRIIPIHITIMGAGILSSVSKLEFTGRISIALFLLLKTLVDAGMYKTLKKSYSDSDADSQDNTSTRDFSKDPEIPSDNESVDG